MRGNELLDKMGLIDDAYVMAADTAPKRKNIHWSKWGTLAACLCLVLAGFLTAALRGAPNTPVLNPENTLPLQDETDVQLSATTLPDVIVLEPLDTGSFIFNEATSVIFVDAARQQIPGYFTEVLSGEELSAILPNPVPSDMTASGHAGFDGEGSLIDVYLRIESPLLDAPASVSFTYGEPFCCYILPGEPAVSVINDTAFTIYQWAPADGEYRFEAYTNISGCSVQIFYETAAGSPDDARADFCSILNYFSKYEDGTPNLSAVSPEYIPEFFSRALSLPDAIADERFGAYMLTELPDGFTEESICRYKDQNSDYLSGLWAEGYNEISWTVCAFDSSSQARVTGITDTENYDLSLYPIPRASSVPDALWEIVQNPIFLAEELTLDAVMARAYQIADAGDSQGWRMEFSVKYGDILIEIRAKGVDPQWLYQQLMTFR